MANQRHIGWIEELIAYAGQKNDAIEHPKLPHNGKLSTNEKRQWNGTREENEEQDENRTQGVHAHHEETLNPAISKDTGDRADEESRNRTRQQNATDSQRRPGLLPGNGRRYPKNKHRLKNEIAYDGDCLATPEQRKISIDEEASFLSRIRKSFSPLKKRN